MSIYDKIGWTILVLYLSYFIFWPAIDWLSNYLMCKKMESEIDKIVLKKHYIRWKIENKGK